MYVLVHLERQEGSRPWCVLQAKAVAEQLKEFDIKRVFVSPFYR